MRTLTAIIICALFSATIHAATTDGTTETSWGTIRWDIALRPGFMDLTINKVPENGKLQLPTPFANITQAYLANDPKRAPLSVTFNPDATKITVAIPKNSKHITLETAEKSTQYVDGRIVFSALDSTVTGTKAKLETHRGNHRVGFWVNIDDYVSWGQAISRPGTYDVELTYSLAGGKGNDIAIDYAGKTLTKTIQSTGSWYVYTTVPVGRVTVTKDGRVPMKVYCTKKTAGAVMNLKAVTLRPVKK